MINVTLGEAKPQEVKPFPKLMRNKEGSLIIFFSEPTNGYVIYLQQGLDYYLGYRSDAWNMLNFSDYNEPLTLQNAQP